MKHDIFISYKSKDIAVTKAITHILESENIQCWYAPRNLDNQAVGRDYDDQIVEAIKACKILIVLLCDESLLSEWVKFEVSCAQKNNKFIIPYVISEISVDNGLFNRLTTKHWIDAFPNPEKKFNLLTNNVKLVMNQFIETQKGTEDSRSFKIEVNHDYENDFDFEEGEVLYQAKETIDAVRAFLISSENGNPKAQKRLCEIFYDLDNEIHIIPNDLWDIIEGQARQGHCYANFLMHTKYYKDSDTFLISFEYLKKATRDSSIAEAFLRLGIHYGWGMGVKQSHILAMHYYNKAASMGLTTSYSYIGQMYESGNNKFEKDIEAAIANYEKGVAENNRRSLKNLCWLYYCEGEYQNLDKARELAQKAIDCGYNEGYAWMGDTYYWTLSQDMMSDIENCEEAQKWYKIAASKDIKAAYSSLANMYWNASEHDRAFQWARRGIKNDDGGSLQALGWFYEHTDGQYEEAWKYYLKYYERYGSGAENLARLYLDYGYRPNAEEYKLNDLVSALEICAKNSDENCINFLIRILSDPEESGKIESDPLKRENRIMEYERIGAHLGFTCYLHKYGMRFFNKEDENNYNPYKGIQWLEKSANRMHKESVDKLLEIYRRRGIEPDKEQHEKWCDFAIVNNMSEDNSHELLSYIRNCTDYKEQYTDYLMRCIRAEKDHEARHGLYKILIPNHHIEGRKLEQSVYDELLDEIRKELDDNNFGYAKDLMQYLYPDFDPKELERGSIELNDETERLYCLTRVSGKEFMLKKQRDILLKIYKDPIADKSMEDACSKSVNVFANGYWHQFFDSSYNIVNNYEALCREFEIEPIERIQLEPKMFYPTVESGLALTIRFWSIESLLSLIRSGHKSFENLSITDSDESILDIAERETNTAIQIYLINFVETMLETESVLIDNYKLMTAYENNEYSKIVTVLDRYRDRLEKSGIAHDLPEVTEEYVRLLFSTSEEESDNSLETEVNDWSSDDDFDRLLDDFIAS